MMEKAMANKRLWDQVSPAPPSLSSVKSSVYPFATKTDPRLCVLTEAITDTKNGLDQAGHVPSSLAFPCILHALAWATQGRDPKVKVKDHRGVGLPEAPEFLREARHVQILITGSLHLVGGALEALTPDMNQ